MTGMAVVRKEEVREGVCPTVGAGWYERRGLVELRGALVLGKLVILMVTGG